MENCLPETSRDNEMGRPNSSINAPIGTPVSSMEPNIWCVRAQEAFDAWEKGAAAEPQPSGVVTWGWLQPWSMPCLLPLGQFSSGEHCISQEEALPRVAEGSVGSPWQRDSNRVQCEPGSWAPAFCAGSQKSEAVGGEEEPPGAPGQPVLQQPPCTWDPKEGTPQQEAQTSDPGQSGQPAGPGWWRGCPLFSALLEWIHCPVLFPPACCPAVFGTREP